MFTQNNKILFEVASAIQKEIRRGNEEGALYWSLELLPRYEKYLWKRLIVIANEDIGIASMETIEFVNVQAQSWFWLREHNAQDELRLVLANAILALCRAPKTRLADHFQCVVTTLWQSNDRKIPDYALDKHTLRGKQMGRGIEFFLDNEDEPLTRQSPIPSPYQEKAWKLWLSGKPAHIEYPKPKPKNGNGKDRDSDQLGIFE